MRITFSENQPFRPERTFIGDRKKPTTVNKNDIPMQLKKKSIQEVQEYNTRIFYTPLFNFSSSVSYPALSFQFPPLPHYLARISSKGLPKLTVRSTTMSTLLHSDPDSLSTDSLGGLEEPVTLKVPLSTSVVLQNANVAPPPVADQKISIRFQPIGSTSAIHPTSFKVSRIQTVASIQKFLMRQLRLLTVHVYVLSSFQPTPDEKLGDLYGLFKTNGELILSYCENVAFG